ELPYHLLTNQHLAYDLVYNPAETLFLKKAKEAGAMVHNGQSMLEIQASQSWKTWQNAEKR
ncbi:MAG TPA: shikimate dehydrogenase, partial [Flavobacteriales bacterium]|nr:shikimate dehydrogenase [Flavobacteriales bacterium]